MKALKQLIIAVSLFASCTLFYSSSNNTGKVDISPTRPARVLVEEQQEYPVKKAYDSKAWKAFSEKGASNVRDYKELHDKSIDEKGYGVFYGSSSKYVEYIKMFGVTPYQSTLMEKMLSDDNFVNSYDSERGSGDLESVALKQVLGEKSPQGFRQPMKTDCLEWCLLNMRQAYKGSGMSQDWKNILETAVKNSNNTLVSKNYGFKGVIGTELAKVLVNDGWVALYYNPDTTIPRDKPAIILPKEEVKKTDLRFLWFDYFVKWTEHVGSYKVAKENRHYYNIPIIDMIVDYNPTTELEDIRFTIKTIVPVKSSTVKKTDKVEKLKQIPFGLLLARGGQHSAILSYGKVYEVHHASGPVDKKLIDVKDFETEWDWLSGVILVPPGSWQK
ncbi:MAG: hypothetical protein Q8O03_07985 [Nanoarchaeota archaeon]|nr:hypothetical protein [Nanoarchaeota archaeon]